MLEKSGTAADLDHHLNGNVVEVPSFNAKVKSLKSDTGSPPSSKLGAHVAPTREMLKKSFMEYEERVWLLEAKINQERREAVGYEVATELALEDLERFRPEYNQIKTKPNAPETFDDYLSQKSEQDPEVKKAVQRYMGNDWASLVATLTEAQLRTTLQDEKAEYAKLLDSGSGTARVAVKARKTVMENRSQQMGNRVEQQRMRVEASNKQLVADQADRTRQAKEKQDALNQRFKAERGKAKDEYNQFSKERKSRQSLDDYLFTKVSRTPEAGNLSDPLDGLSQELDNAMSHQELKEMQDQYRRLRQRGTTLRETTSLFEEKYGNQPDDEGPLFLDDIDL